MSWSLQTGDWSFSELYGYQDWNWGKSHPFDTLIWSLIIIMTYIQLKIGMHHGFYVFRLLTFSEMRDSSIRSIGCQSGPYGLQYSSRTHTSALITLPLHYFVQYPSFSCSFAITKNMFWSHFVHLFSEPSSHRRHPSMQLRHWLFGPWNYPSIHWIFLLKNL